MSAPRLLAAVATSPRLVVAEFDQDVVITGGVEAILRRESAPAVTPRVSLIVADGPSASITLETEMTRGASYALVVTGVENALGEIGGPDDEASFAGFAPSRPTERRFDLWQMMPAYNRRIDATGDLERLLACLQEVLDLILSDMDAFPAVFSIERAPEAFIDLILADLGNPFRFALTLHEKRRLASVLTIMYAQKATDRGIENAIRFFLGTEATVRPFQFEGLILGESELGVDWVLGPSDSFSRYAFDIEVDRVLTPDERDKIHAVVNFMKRVATHFMLIREPGQSSPPAHWSIGESELGVDTVLS